jgi:signal transduction histidine kinase
MRYLYELLDDQENSLLDTWTAALRDSGLSTRLDENARDVVQSFLFDLKTALRHAPVNDTPPLANLESAGNGIETRRVAQDPIAATRAYGFLHDIILDAAAERGVEVGLAEQKTLAWHVNDAIGRAVAVHLQIEQADLHRIAHELRNPLGSAMMALTLLRSRVDLGDHVRLADVIQRNLERVERALDDAVIREPKVESGNIDPAP